MYSASSVCVCDVQDRYAAISLATVPSRGVRQYKVRYVCTVHCESFGTHPCAHPSTAASTTKRAWVVGGFDGKKEEEKRDNEQ